MCGRIRKLIRRVNVDVGKRALPCVLIFVLGVSIGSFSVDSRPLTCVYPITTGSLSNTVVNIWSGAVHPVSALVKETGESSPACFRPHGTDGALVAENDLRSRELSTWRDLPLPPVIPDYIPRIWSPLKLGGSDTEDDSPALS
jgi:hypothetical protein